MPPLFCHEIHFLTRLAGDCQCTPGWLLELNSQEGVQNRVQAAVEIGQSLGDRNPFLQQLEHVAGGRDHFHHDEGVQKEAATVGQPAWEETHNEDDCGLQRFLLQRLDFDALGQLGDDNTIADEDDQTGQYKTNQDVLKVKHNSPYDAGLLWVEALTNGPGVFTLHAVVNEVDVCALHPCKHQVRYSKHSSRKPNTHIDHSAGEQFSCDLAVGGPDNCKVSVQTDEGQDEHAAVQVDCVDHVHKDAHETSKVPAAGGIHSPEGQGNDKQEVSHWEMEPVLVSHRFDLFLVAHDDYNQPIANDSQDKNYSINCWEENLVEVSAGICATWLL